MSEISKEVERLRSEYGIPHDLSHYGSEGLRYASHVVSFPFCLPRVPFSEAWPHELWERYENNPKKRLIVAAALVAIAAECVDHENSVPVDVVRIPKGERVMMKGHPNLPDGIYKLEDEVAVEKADV